MVGKQKPFHKLEEEMPNFQHPNVIEYGENWIKFGDAKPGTLDEILEEDVLINRLTDEGNGVWYVEFEFV